MRRCRSAGALGLAAQRPAASKPGRADSLPSCRCRHLRLSPAQVTISSYYLCYCSDAPCKTR